MRKLGSVLLSMMVLAGTMMYGNVGVQAAVSEPTNTPAVATEGQIQDTVTENIDNEKYSVTFSTDRKTVAISNKDQLQVSIKSIDVYHEGTVNHYEVDNGMGASNLIAGNDMITTGELLAITKVVVTYEYNEFRFPTGADILHPDHNHTFEDKDVQRAAIALSSGLDLTANGIEGTTFKQGATKHTGDTTWTDDVFEITVHRNDEHPELSTVDIKAIKEGFTIVAVDGTDCWEKAGSGVTGLPVSQAYNVFYYYDEILKEEVPDTEDQKPETKPELPEINWGQIGDLPITGVDVAVFAAVSAGLAGLGFTVRKMSKGNKDNDEE